MESNLEKEFTKLSILDVPQSNIKLQRVIEMQQLKETQKNK